PRRGEQRDDDAPCAFKHAPSSLQSGGQVTQIGATRRAALFPASWISCFFILLYRVGRYSPRICAASCLFQFVRWSVCTIAIFSISASVRCGGMTNSAAVVLSLRNDSGRSPTAISCPLATRTP